MNAQQASHITTGKFIVERRLLCASSKEYKITWFNAAGYNFCMAQKQIKAPHFVDEVSKQLISVMC